MFRIFFLALLISQPLLASCDDCATLINKFLPSKSEVKNEVMNLPTSNKYKLKQKSDDEFFLEWHDNSIKEISNYCKKLDFREKVEEEFSKFESFESNIYKGNGNNYILKEAILEVLNKSILSSLRVHKIKFVSVENTDVSTDVEFELMSLCGYSVNYQLGNRETIVKGSHIK